MFKTPSACRQLHKKHYQRHVDISPVDKTVPYPYIIQCKGSLGNGSATDSYNMYTRMLAARDVVDAYAEAIRSNPEVDGDIPWITLSDACQIVGKGIELSTGHAIVSDSRDQRYLYAAEAAINALKTPATYDTLLAAAQYAKMAGEKSPLCPKAMCLKIRTIASEQWNKTATEMLASGTDDPQKIIAAVASSEAWCGNGTVSPNAPALEASYSSELQQARHLCTSAVNDALTKHALDPLIAFKELSL